MGEYCKTVRQAMHEFEDVNTVTINDALQYLEVEDKVYNQSLEEAKQDPQTMQVLLMVEEETRQSFEPGREVTESREVIKKIHKERLNQDFAVEMSLAQKEKLAEATAMDNMMMLRTQIIDTIFLKYNIKQSDLVRAVRHY